MDVVKGTGLLRKNGDAREPNRGKERKRERERERDREKERERERERKRERERERDCRYDSFATLFYPVFMRTLLLFRSLVILPAIPGP